MKITNSILFIALFALAACAPQKVQAEKTANFKIVTYNILVGLKGPGDRLEKAVAWIKNEDPDVLALQECNGFDRKSLKAAAARWGHPYSDICKIGGYPVAITSKKPITTIEKRLKGMHHGYLHCKISGVHYFVVHLSPGSYTKRLSEADIITKKVRGLMDRGERVVVLGDFNALSSADKTFLKNKKESLARLKCSDDDYFGFNVMAKFDKIGLQDICYKLLKNTKALDGSCPSMIKHNAESQAKYLRRIDYVLMDKKSASRCLSASIPRNKVTDAISDHYPVVVTLHLEPEKETGENGKPRE